MGMLDGGLAAGSCRRDVQQTRLSPLASSPGAAEAAVGAGQMAHVCLTLSIFDKLNHADLIITGGSMPIALS